MKVILLVAALISASIFTAVGIINMGSSIQEIKAKHEAELMKHPNVVSVGIGKNDSGVSAIIIGIGKESAALKAQLSGELDGFPVLIKTVGSIRTQNQKNTRSDDTE